MPCRGVVVAVLVGLTCGFLASCARQPQPGKSLDEARLAGRTAESFPRAADDYFHGMDGGVALTAQENRGRNQWLVWTGGNDRFWNQLAQSSSGAFDLLKVISSRPGEGFSRGRRWRDLGLVNEPCFQTPTGPDSARHGLWLDVRGRDCPPDPFEDSHRYPGLTAAVSAYGYATGVMGLRLFPNPDFDEAAARDWDPERYYTDPAYYSRPGLIRPYRVGVSCGFCHVGVSPVRPPADPESPAFADLSSTAGAQSLRISRLFVANRGPEPFILEVLRTHRPGSLDTSLIATDSINNPRAINPLYDLASRLELARRLSHERLAGGELHNRPLHDFATDGTPHLLMDGADSTGLPGALQQSYLNFGLFSEEVMTHFNPLVGGTDVSPVDIEVARRNSVYWQVAEAATPDLVQFLLKVTQPEHLKDAAGGTQYLTADERTLAHGKEVFADVCARCHSSKAPTPPPELNLDADRCSGTLYLECFRRYWTWTQSDSFKSRMRALVAAPDFLQDNYLSSDARIPVTLLRTNVCSPLASNAVAGHVWDNFSSHSYKQLPAVGAVTLYDPASGERMSYEMPAGGRGYTRVPSLIGIWASAPFLLNNSVGPFDPDPSVAARLRVFDASIEQLLWPEKRERDALLGDRIPGVIDRTAEDSELVIPANRVPDTLAPLLDAGQLRLAPISKGTPVGLLANLQLRAQSTDAPAQSAHQRDLREAVRNLQGPALLRLSQCPDLVVNRGHYFGTARFNEQESLTADEQAFGKEPELGDDDKRALIAFLKTF